MARAIFRCVKCSCPVRFQSLRSPSSNVIRVAIRQQSSVLSANRTWMYRRPSSNLCSTQFTTFPRKPRYWRPGTKVRGLGILAFCFLMDGGIRDRLVVSPITAFEVLSQLSITNADEVLRQIHAVHNWCAVEGAGLLAWPDEALARRSSIPASVQSAGLLRPCITETKNPVYLACISVQCFCGVSLFGLIVETTTYVMSILLGGSTAILAGHGFSRNSPNNIQGF